MRDADFARFTVALSAVAELHGRTLSEAAMLLWWQALVDHEIDQVEHALRACIRDPETGRYMPKPADVIRHLRGNPADEALIAWGAVLSAARGGGPCELSSVARLALDTLGGGPGGAEGGDTA